MSTNKKNIIVSCLVVIMLIFAMTAMTLTIEPQKAYAATPTSSVSSIDDLTFTQITDSKGQPAYKVAIKTASRSTAEFIVIPDTYNGLPVSEIADSGFLSCTKLVNVILPSSIEKIGLNAFMNCSKLERVPMPRVKTISNNAFAMCTSLERLFIPSTVETVGTTILRNNPNTVYIQAASIGSGWSSTWNSYFTGTVLTDVRPEATISYQEIMDVSNTDVIGYELTEGQFLSAPDDDIVIYSSYSADGTNYLPVLNICPQAFSFSQAKSLTIKHEFADNVSAPLFNHEINLRSSAFAYSFINEINIEVDVTLNHPENLQGGPFISWGDGSSIIEGDEFGKSTNLFFESSMSSVTLPDNLDLITDYMFYNCAFLENIKIAGAVYNGENRLPNIQRIGTYAFNACTGFENLFVPATVATVGESAFNDCGTGQKQQTINIDIYEDVLPDGWNSNWSAGINSLKATIDYKPLVPIALNLQGGTGITEIKVKPGSAMPEFGMPERGGYIFKGFYSGVNGTGIQYYTDNMQSVKVWNNGDTQTLFAHWEKKVLAVTLDDGIGGTRTIDAEFGKAMPAADKPLRNGYKFNGYYLINENSVRIFYYNENMGSVRNWDVNGNATLHADWIIVEYSITFITNKNFEVSNPNPVKYTVADDITFANLVKDGYTFVWSPASIPSGSTGNKTVTGTWTAIEYNINYTTNKNPEVYNPNPTKYTVEDSVTFIRLAKDGYSFVWNTISIPSGSTGNKTITGTWTAIEYWISYTTNKNFEIINFNPVKYTVEDSITFADLSKHGYNFVWNPIGIPLGSTGDKSITGTWTAIQYDIIYTTYKNLEVSNPNPAKYTVEDSITFANLIKNGYNFVWNPASIPLGSTGTKYITGTWTAIEYTIDYTTNKNKEVSNPNPVKYTVEDAITFAKLAKDGYTFVWNPASIPLGSMGNKIVTGTWTAIQYEIKYEFNKNLGVQNPNPAKYTVEDAVTFVNLVKDGYNFVWNPASIPLGSTGNKIVTGTWTAIEYTIDYTTNKNKEVSNPNPVKYTVEDAITFAKLAKDGYTFVWNPASIPLGSTGNKIVTGTWTAIEYKITYNVDSKGLSNPNTTKYTVEDAITFAKLAKDGYTFEWNPAGIILGSTGDIIVTGTWTAIEYTISYSFNKDLGVNNPNPTKYTVEQAITFSTLSKNGYTFVWSPASIPLGSIGDKTVTGTWAAIEYIITYNVDFKGLSNPNPTKYTIEDAITFVKLEKNGYSFVWNPSSIAKGTTGDKTVTGTWTAIEYTITYVGDFKGLSNPNPAKYTVEDSITFAKLVKAGYNFEWSPASIAKGSTGNKTVTGTWTAIRFIITYNVDWKGLSNPNPTSYTVEDAVTFVKLVTTGYTFEWSQAIIAKGSTGDISIKGTWTKKEYVVKYVANRPNNASTSVTGSTSDSRHVYDIAKNLTSNGYSLANWQFTGWNTKADGSGTSYADGASVKNLTDGEQITLYAQWKDLSTVTYSFKLTNFVGVSIKVNANGTEIGNTATLQYGTEVTIFFNSQMRDYCIMFNGTYYGVNSYSSITFTMTENVLISIVKIPPDQHIVIYLW